MQVLGDQSLVGFQRAVFAQIDLVNREPIAVEDLKAMTRLAVRLFRHRKAEVPALEEDAQVDVAVQHQAHAAEGGHLVEAADLLVHRAVVRSEEHTSELQSLMRISYAVFCLKKKTQ